jgi:hypothetical protein
MAAFRRGLQELGWTDGSNVQIDFRSGLADADRYRRYAAELVALVPDVLLANGGSTLGPLQQVTRTCRSCSYRPPIRSAVAKGTADAPSPAYVTDFLATSDGLSLVKAFMCIKDPKLRRAIVRLVEEIAPESA